MDLKITLQELGLSDNEARVYLALLQLGPSSVLTIARQIDLKRPTIYLVLDALMIRGAVALVPKERKRLFIALSPEKLQEELERKVNTAQKALPELIALFRTQSEKPIVQLYDGREGILTVYREIATNPRTNEILSFLSLEAIPKEFYEVYELFIRLYKNKMAHGRELVYAKNINHFYLQQLRSLPNYEARLVAKNQKLFTDNIIYGNNVAMFSFKKRFALVVKSEDVVGSLRSLFESAWKTGTKT